jgi:hypothetical protein
MNRGAAIQNELDRLKQKLGESVQSAYATGDSARARSEADHCLTHTLSQFEAMLGFPDSRGMDAMAHAVELVARSMLRAGDESGAKELLNRPWAFGGALPDLEKLKSKTTT